MSVPKPLQDFFESIKKDLTEHQTYLAASEEDEGEQQIEDILDKIEELYYAVESELELLQDNQLDPNTQYIALPLTYDLSNELAQDKLEEYLRTYGVADIVHLLNHSPKTLL